MKPWSAVARIAWRSLANHTEVEWAEASWHLGEDSGPVLDSSECPLRWHSLKHLPKCSACKDVIAHVNRESKILVRVHQHRCSRSPKVALTQPISWGATTADTHRVVTAILRTAVVLYLSLGVT
jgi:hypothetical protein